MSKTLMKGLSLPAKLPRGRSATHEIEPWVEICQILMGRGVNTPYRMRKLLGVSYRTADRWMAIVRQRWAEGLTRERLNWRRESLYREADEVARHAWESALDAEGTTKSHLLKLVIEANKRKAALCGLDSQTVQVSHRIEATATVDVIARVEESFSLAPGALAAIGKQAAVLLSVPEVLDVEAEERPVCAPLALVAKEQELDE